MSLFSLGFIVFIFVLLIIYYCIPGKYQWICLLIGSLFFYITGGSLRALIYIALTILSTFICALLIEKSDIKYRSIKSDTTISSEVKAECKLQSNREKRALLAVGLLINFGTLFIIKYGSFSATNINRLFSKLQFSLRIPTVSLLLPLGISFYTFQATGYLIDIYRSKYSADHNILKYSLFITFFPQILQGPIGRHDQLAAQLLAPHSWDDMCFREGLLRTIWGFFKKIVISERIAIIVNEVFQYHRNYSGFVTFTAVLFYGLQIYTDFSGGMDIVIGIAEMFGIRMSENFRQPFFARSISEFWQRWHITLGNWMKDYVFYSISFSSWYNRLQKKTRTWFGRYYGRIVPSCIASFAVFMLVGIWHGSSWKYIAYGLYNSIFVFSEILFERLFSRQKAFLHINETAFSWRVFQIVRTVILVTFGRYFSRAVSFKQAIQMWKETFREFNPWVLFDGSLYKLGVNERTFHFMTLTIILLFIVDLLNEKGIIVRTYLAKQDTVTRWVTYIAGITAILVFGVYGSGYNAGSFIYQNF